MRFANSSFSDGILLGNFITAAMVEQGNDSVCAREQPRERAVRPLASGRDVGALSVRRNSG
jgi:hypothetical protein